MSLLIPPLSASVGTTLLTRHLTSSLSSDALEKDIVQLKDQIQKLKSELEETQENLISQQVNAHIKENIYWRIKHAHDDLQNKVQLQQLISQLHPNLASRLTAEIQLTDSFNSDTPSPCYIISIDIRRSTELMLRATSPEAFGKFIIDLCEGLRNIILTNYGVFDKFTGDGVLAFFPEFYSEKDAGLLALRTAFQAHEFFNDHYKSSRPSFSTVLYDVGLGIGIDYGTVNIVKINSYTVVGAPVVFACRLSNANHGDTLLNQQAYDALAPHASRGFECTETTLRTKYEELVVYKATPNGREIKCEPPEWGKVDRIGIPEAVDQKPATESESELEQASQPQVETIQERPEES